MDWQTIRDLAYSRQRLIMFVANAVITVLSMTWMFSVIILIIEGGPLSTLQEFFVQLVILPILYIVGVIVNFRVDEIQISIQQRYFRYRFTIPDSKYRPFYDWAISQGWAYDRNYSMVANFHNPEWSYEIGFERADHWMLAKLKF